MKSPTRISTNQQTAPKNLIASESTKNNNNNKKRINGTTARYAIYRCLMRAAQNKAENIGDQLFVCDLNLQVKFYAKWINLHAVCSWMHSPATLPFTYPDAFNGKPTSWSTSSMWAITGPMHLNFWPICMLCTHVYDVFCIWAYAHKLLVHNEWTFVVNWLLAQWVSQFLSFLIWILKMEPFSLTFFLFTFAMLLHLTISFCLSLAMCFPYIYAT